MKLYFEMLKKPVFHMSDVNRYYDNMESAYSAVQSLLKKKLAVRIRRDMYTCISGETGCPIANKYQIACAISPGACISHHTAMEYYGVCNQVYYDIYVSAEKPFTPFEFEGYSYHYVPAKINDEIEEIKYSGGVWITSKERTLVDSIKDIDRISGIEEVRENISNMGKLNEQKIVHLLKKYHNQFLYQKMGFLLSPYKDQMGLSSQFFEVCKLEKGKSKRYLTDDMQDGRYNKVWGLIVPKEA